MEGIKTYRFPTINHGYGQMQPQIGHMRPTVSKVSSCVIDTPRDDGRTYRENLWSFQKHHRGVKSQDDPLPDIPFRLRSNELGDQNIDSTNPGVPLLDSYGTGQLPESTFVRQLTRTRTTISDTIPAIKKDTPFLAKGVSMPFTRSLRLCSRQRNIRPCRQAGGSVTERLPRVSGKQVESEESPPLKKTSSLTDIKEDTLERTSSADSDDMSSVFIDVNSDNVGHTTNSAINTTLADILNKHNNWKYHDIDKTTGRSNQGMNESDLTECENDKHWKHKFGTKIVDGNSYDNFARTRKSEFEKELTKNELKCYKRPLNQKPSENTLCKSAEGKTSAVVQRDTCAARKLGHGQAKKHSKLKLALSNNKSSD